MIDIGYVRTMARYNAWQNAQVHAACARLAPAALTVERGAFFGTILGTLNHVLWGDRFWMSRLGGWQRPPGSIAESVALTPTLEAWWADRARADAKIRHWADRLRHIDLHGDLSWYSGSLGCEVTKSRAACIAHMFNHQTHHRGQVHAMLTAAGADPGVTDLVFMPADSV